MAKDEKKNKEAKKSDKSKGEKQQKDKTAKTPEKEVKKVEEKPKADKAEEEKKISKDSKTEEKVKGDKNEEKSKENINNKQEKDTKKHDVILTYFDGTGRAELSRLILAYAGIEYEDRRIDATEWLKLKPDTPFLQLPILEYHGRTLCQSISIARFLAKKTKIYGKDEFIQAKVDAVVDYLTDYNNKWVGVFRTNTPEDRIEMINGLFAHFLPLFFQNLEAFLEREGGKYFAGNEFSFADLCVFQNLCAFSDPNDPFFNTLPNVEDRFEALDHFPLLREHQKRIYNIPGIKKWVDNRPRGLF